MLFPESREDIGNIACHIGSNPYFIMSSGSNMLFNDIPFDGMIVNMSRFCSIKHQEGSLTVSSGTRNSDIIKFAKEKGVSNLVFLAGIPGRTGGALYMNAGAYGHCISDLISSIELFDMKEKKFININRKSMDYFYRGQGFIKPWHIIVSGVFQIQCGDPERTKKDIESIINSRSSKHPPEPSAGSVFKNPPGHTAGRLLEELGLKGKTRGGARISDKHANFIVNMGNARFADVMYLIRDAKAKTLEKYDIQLETEIRIIESLEDFYRL